MGLLVRCLGIIAVVTSVFAAPFASFAGVLETHSLVHARTFFGHDLPTILPGEEVRETSNIPLDTGPLFTEWSSGGAHSAKGWARAVSNSSSTSVGFMGVSTSGYCNQANLFTLPGSGYALAGHRDIAFTDSIVHPETIRLSFRVDGVFEVPEYLVQYPVLPAVTSSLRVYTTTDAIGLFSDVNSGYGTSDPSISFVNNIYQPAGNSRIWDTVVLEAVTRSFSGSLHLDVPYDAGLGGFAWGILINATSNALGGEAGIDFLNAVSLTGVTLLDGSPIQVTFDSGLQFVPPTLNGDFNKDGHVDSADYVVWRHGFGSTYTSFDYDLWRANFGQSLVGSGATAIAASVPEPHIATIASCGVLSCFAVRFRRRKLHNRAI